jgi:hypothetical protein
MSRFYSNDGSRFIKREIKSPIISLLIIINCEKLVNKRMGPELSFTEKQSSSEGRLISLRLILLGDSGVGKSSISKRFVKDTFDEQINTTIGIDFMVKIIEFEGKRIKLTIWVSKIYG